MREDHIAILVSLDVKDAFDAAWLPSTLKTLKEFNCPKILYNVAKSYFSERTAILTTNSIQMDTEVTEGCPQVSCCGHEFGKMNIPHHSILNLENETKK